MRKRTLAVLLGAIVFVWLAAVGCANVLARGATATGTPTRTPRPTFTPAAGAFLVATPTIDATRFPEAAQTAQAGGGTAPQVFVPGGQNNIFVPVQPGGPVGVQTVVVVIVTATPPPPPTWTPGPPTQPPPPTWTPGPPTATPTNTGTPLPPVKVRVTVDNANVRQGPGPFYPVVTKLKAGTEITVVGRNRDGDWWKVCCVNGQDVWIADAVVETSGPIWSIAEESNVPPPPPTPIPPPPTPTLAPSPTFAWPMRVEGQVREYPNPGNNFFRVDAIIYNGVTPLYGYKLRIRKTSTGQEWLSEGSQTAWYWYVLQYPNDDKPVNVPVDCPNPRKGLLCVRSNVKWDSNGLQVPLGDDVWEVTATDGGGKPLSTPVRITTSATNPKWYHITFTSAP